jgi:hypothetical protein
MGRFVDSIIALRILNLLVTPFENTEAYKRGIIDTKGKELKKMSELNTVEDRDAYTLLHRLVYRLKRIIEKVPIDNKKIVSLAAAYSLIKEHTQLGKEPLNLEEQYIRLIGEDLTEEIAEVEKILDEKKIFTFKQFSEETGMVAPANNAMATSGIAGLDKDVPVSKKAQKKYTASGASSMFRRNKAL